MPSKQNIELGYFSVILCNKELKLRNDYVNYINKYSVLNPTN